MPKIFEYLGIVFYFYSNEHEPIHVHAEKGEYESKAEFIIKNGEIESVRITNVRGKERLKGADLKNFKNFLERYSDEIVTKWVDYFVYRKNVNFERITRRLK